MPGKVKVGLFSLTCCEGCIFTLLDLEKRLLAALPFIEIVESPALLEKPRSGNQKIDISFVEGAVISDGDLESLRRIREKSSALVALGACAAITGIPGLRNALPKSLEEKIQRVKTLPVHDKAAPLSAFVQVDFVLPGCSVNENEFLDFVHKLLYGRKPRLEDVPVCFECKIRQNPCLLLEGIPCLGPVSFAGCDALCPGSGAQCIGCRGFTKDANLASLDSLFKEMGTSMRDRHNLFTYFNALPQELKHLKEGE
jgi:coenzyme F420-reducing hydrogenase gamma subunit